MKKEPLEQVAKSHRSCCMSKQSLDFHAYTLGKLQQKALVLLHHCTYHNLYNFDTSASSFHSYKFGLFKGMPKDIPLQAIHIPKPLSNIEFVLLFLIISLPDLQLHHKSSNEPGNVLRMMVQVRHFQDAEHIHRINH